MDMKILDHVEAARFCDIIKLSDFNYMQSYGALLALNEEMRVVQYSENVSALLNTPIHQILELPITERLHSTEAEDDVIAWLKSPTIRYKKLWWVYEGGKLPVVVYISRHSQGIVLEIEKNIETAEEANTLFNLSQVAISSMKNTMHCQEINELAQKTCEELQKLSGYDRVIIYKFDEHDHSGMVIGEAFGNQEMESYLGLKFPANDIPKSVREMYMALPFRYIPSTDNENVNVVPEINPNTNNYLDLSQINLRMVAPVHIKYMHNMNIKAAISIGIVQDNKLWGLIACHHQQEKYISLNLRLTLMLVANSVATQLLALENTQDYREELKTVDLQTALTDNISKADTISAGIELYHQQLMDLVSAEGMSVYLHGTLLSYGVAPTHLQTINLITWLQTQNLPIIYATSTLPMEYEACNDFKNIACGLPAIKITAVNNHYIIFYKPEQIDTITWAGNPAKSLKCSSSTYSPRDSFERFLETIHNQSSLWSHRDIKSAGFIRSIVANKQLQDLLQTQAMHDPLTSLLNRSYLEQRLALEVQRASRQHLSLTVVIIDIDFFKKMNDQFGHQAGDAVLVKFAELIQAYFRDYDDIYRYGGDEFLLIMQDTTLSQAKQKADALRNEVKNLKVMFNQLVLPPISISIGVAVYPDNGVDARSLIAAADGALYQAKKNGRDQVVNAMTR